MTRLDLDLHAGRRDGLEMLGKKAAYGLAILIRHQTHGYLRVRLGRKHRLCALAGVAAPNAVHIEARPYARTLQSAVALLAAHLGYIQELLVLLHIERRPREHSPVAVGKLHHIVIETLHGNASLLIDERGDHLAKHIDRIGHGPAVMTGMQVLVRAGHLDLHIGESAHSAIDGRNLLRNHGRIGNENHIRSKQILVLLGPGGQRRTADLLLALEDELHILSEPAFAKHIFEGLQVHE